MNTKKLIIARIPAIKTANHVATILFFLSIILQVIKGAPPSLQDKSFFEVLGNYMLGAFCIGIASWIISAIGFAVYNKVSRRTGGVFIFVNIEEQGGEQGVPGYRRQSAPQPEP